MTKPPILLLFCVAPLLLAGKDAPVDAGAAQLVWERSVYTPGQDTGGGVAVLASGDIIVAGATNFRETEGDKQSPSFDETYKSDAWVVALDATGKRKWDLALGGADYDNFSGIVSTPNDQLIAVGTSQSEPGPGKSAPHHRGLDLWVVGISSDGARLWDKTFHQGYWNVPRSICRDSGNGCFVGGETAPGYYDTQGWVLHLDAIGNLIWEHFYGDSAATVSAVAFADDGRLILGGDRHTPPVGLPYINNFWMACADPANGSLRWQLLISKGQSSRCRAVLATRDGGAVGVGHFVSTASHELGKDIVWIVKASRTGERLWDRELRNPPDISIPEGVVETDDGGMVITSNGGDWGREVRIVRLTPDGDTQWTRSFIAGGWIPNRSCITAADGGWLVLSLADGPSPDRANSSVSNSSDLWLMRFAPELTFVQRDPPELIASRSLGSHLSTDGFRFSLIGTNGGRYVTERSADLISWEPFTTNTASMSDVKLFDPHATAQNKTHYRTRTLPSP